MAMILLGIPFLLTVVLDVFYTYHLLNTRPQDESNSLIRWLYGKAGALRASLLGVCVPSAVIATLCAIFNADLLFAWYVGVRSCVGFTQVLKLTRQ